MIPSTNSPIYDKKLIEQGCPRCVRVVAWIVNEKEGYKECPRCGLKVRLAK